MKIMVFDVAAESGGALSVLHEFYDEFKLDYENEYIFVLSLPELKGTSNIKVLRYPWIKKSWIHRLYFDHFIAPRLIKKYNVDSVLSLQNIIIPHTNVYQSVFVHNALPFSEYHFKFNENWKLWIYQNIIGKKILKSIRESDNVVVQTKWMKERCVSKLKISSEKIQIKPPKLDIQVKDYYKETKDSVSTFFYPASGVEFKNHKVIIDACLSLKHDGIADYKVVLTLKGDENKHILDLYNTVMNEQLPIIFAGSMKRDEVFNFYSKSILIFPSYIETVGLPLIEAKLHKTPIIVADCEYAKSILINYNKKYWFNYKDSLELCELMSKFIKRCF